mmetsp:Transcript_44076/g.106262  ORF Transcript_44076/g.106262 Transcript_44076/m.106262 type:complete len:101 (-) Transcript_44076:76-378(-)
MILLILERSACLEIPLPSFVCSIEDVCIRSASEPLRPSIGGTEGSMPLPSEMFILTIVDTIQCVLNGLLLSLWGMKWVEEHKILFESNLQYIVDDVADKR